MTTPADKIQAPKNQSSATPPPHPTAVSGEPTLSLIDRRPEAVTQRKLQALARHNPQAAQLNALQGLARTTAPTVQRITYEEAKKSVDPENATILDEWLKMQSTEKTTWGTILQGMTKDDVNHQLYDFKNQINLRESPTNYKTYDEIKAMTLEDLDAYAKKQADWHASQALTSTKRDFIRVMLNFARSGYLAPCAKMLIEHLENAYNTYTSTDFFGSLIVYSEAVEHGNPIRLTRNNHVDTVLSVGSELKLLKDSINSDILKGALPEEILYHYVEQNKTEEVIDYYRNVNPTPIFQSKNGSDFLAYLELSVTENKKPKDYYTGDLRDAIRNYHRFTKNTLDKLVDNYADTSKSKPLTLILHSALDNNGAFIRDPNLEAVVTNKKMLTLLIEGKTKLDDVKSNIKPLAEKYGIHNKIDQVMIAGHGGAHVIELAGELQNDGKLNPNEELIESHDAIRLDHHANQAQAQDLFDTILDNMDDLHSGIKIPSLFSTPAHRRILFNACLTNSNDISEALDNDDPDAARRQIRDFINNNSNLVRFVESRITEKNKNVKVRGSNASHGRLDMLDRYDNLDLISDKDPKITASKLKYVEYGTEPAGAMRAVLECWATDNNSQRNRLRKLMKKRAKKTGTSWNDTLIKSLYNLVCKDSIWNKGESIRRFASIAKEVSHALQMVDCKVNKFRAFETFNGITDILFPTMASTKEWSTTHYIPLVFYQVWMRDPNTTNNNIPINFLNHLGTYTSCAEPNDFVDIDAIAPKIVTLFQTDASDKGKLILALLGVLHDNANCKAYLTGMLNPDGEFDTALQVNDLLGGLATEDNILIRIGSKQLPGKKSKPTDKIGNITLESNSNNRYYIHSVTKKGKVSRTKSMAYKNPDSKEEAGLLHKDSDVHIIGEGIYWYALEYMYPGNKPGTAFIEKKDINVVNIF